MKSTFISNRISNQTIRFLPSTPSSTTPAGSIRPSSEDGEKSKTPVGAIVGGIVGGVAAAAAIILVALFIWRRRRRTHDVLEQDGTAYSPVPDPFQHGAPPGGMAYTGEQISYSTQNLSRLTPKRLREHSEAQPSAVALSASSGPTIPSVSQNPPSTMSPEPVSPASPDLIRTPMSPHSDITGLRDEMRTEMQNLRRVVEQIAAPPEYVR